MKTTIYRTTLAMLPLVILAACGHPRTTNDIDTRPRDETTFAPAGYPIELQYADSLRPVDDPSAGYFDSGSWQVADGAPGKRLITLSLAGSNEITTGLWRLGASRNPAAVDDCLLPPPDAQAMSSTITVGGQPFHGFTLSDAGMSHFQRIEGYRAVVDGVCYAIDLIVQGTNGEVYDPPREAPYSRDEAMALLRAISDGVSLTSD